MRYVFALTGAVLIGCCFTSSAETNVSCAQALTAPLRSGDVLTVQSRPSGIEIVGVDQQTVHVTCSGDSQSVENTRLRFTAATDGGTLAIEGAHIHHGNNNLHIRIEVPWKTNLRIRMFAGEVKVEEIKGDKDIELYAGQSPFLPCINGTTAA